MPYRAIRLRSKRSAETFLVRVTDAAVAEWLRERASLRRRGYPDRPPDVDAPTMRAWLPRPGEERLPYFADHSWSLAPTGAGEVFPVYTATWHRLNGYTTKVLVTGAGDGSFLSRVVIVDAAGSATVDKAHRLGPDVDPAAVWAEIEVIVRAINESPMDWGPSDPVVTTYLDFLALDAEVKVAEAEAFAAGLLAPKRVH